MWWCTPLSQSFTIHSTMKDVENKLNERRFMRVHRSYIVNLDAIHSIKYSMIRVKGMEKEIPIGGSYHKDILASRIGCCEFEQHGNARPRDGPGVFVLPPPGLETGDLLINSQSLS